MGVVGLMTYLVENRHECSETVDLIEVARQRGFIEILTDFFSFEYFALRHFWSGLSQLRENKYLPILGGEYHSQHKFFTKLIRDLQAARIHLVFYVDGARGSSVRQTNLKMTTWQSRQQQDLARVKHFLDICGGEMSDDQMHNSEFLLPVLGETDLFATLAELGCEVVHCPAGEADEVIAKAFASRQNAYCILSNDTDFCIFPDCKMIMEDFFDINGYLGLDRAGEQQQQQKQQQQQQRPEKLMCSLFSTQRLMQCLNIPFQCQLVEMSIVNGNDFTIHHMRRYHSQIGLGGKRTMPMVADWVQYHGSVEMHPFLSSMLKQCPEFWQAVQFSRDFYSQQTPSENGGVAGSGYISHLIESSVSRGVFPSDFMAMWRHFYWHRMVLEERRPGQPTVETALLPMRQALYQMLLPPGFRCVLEHGHTSSQPLEVRKVYALAGSELPAVHKIKSHQVKANLRTFHRAMALLDSGCPDKGENWFEVYGRKTGFLIYVLRHWLKLNWGRNLGVTEAEFLAMVATVMGNTDPAHCQSLCLHPTPRCVTLGNWFQDVYRHAYLFLGKMLHVSGEFPPPHQVFSGAVWTAFFTCSNTQAWNTCIKLQVPVKRLRAIEDQWTDIIEEKHSLILSIVKDIPDFDTRF